MGQLKSQIISFAVWSMKITGLFQMLTFEHLFFFSCYCVKILSHGFSILYQMLKTTTEIVFRPILCDFQNIGSSIWIATGQYLFLVYCLWKPSRKMNLDSYKLFTSYTSVSYSGFGSWCRSVCNLTFFCHSKKQRRQKFMLVFLLLTN